MNRWIAFLCAVLLVLAPIAAEAAGPPQALSPPAPSPSSGTLGVWQRKGVVIYPNPTLPNPRNAAEPTLIQPEGNPQVLTGYSTVWKMWFSEAGGIFYAESPDGVNWTVYTGGQTFGSVVYPCAQSFVIENSSTYYMYCNGSGTLNEYTSANGTTWTLVTTGVISRSGVTSYSNSGGIVVAGTLNLFVEDGAGLALWTSTDFQHFTQYTGANATGPHNELVGQSASPTYACGPSVPYLLNGVWQLWTHNCGTGAQSGIARWSAPALTGPWTQNVYQDLPVGVIDEGVNVNQALIGFPASQVADPFVMEYGGVTYLYYSGTNLCGSNYCSEVKLAIANMPMAQLVQTAGGVVKSSIENPRQLGGVYFDPVTNALNFNGEGIESIGTIAGVTTLNAPTSGTQISMSGGINATNYMSAGAFFVPNNGIVGYSNSNGIQFSSSGYMTAKVPMLLAGPYSAAGTALPTCNSSTKGALVYVSDATSPTYGGAYTSGGAVLTPVFCNGTAWVTH